MYALMMIDDIHNNIIDNRWINFISIHITYISICYDNDDNNK